jgi:hypothetical protein
MALAEADGPEGVRVSAMQKLWETYGVQYHEHLESIQRGFAAIAESTTGIAALNETERRHLLAAMDACEALLPAIRLALKSARGARPARPASARPRRWPRKATLGYVARHCLGLRFRMNTRSARSVEGL